MITNRLNIYFQILLDHGAKVNAVDVDEWTPLHLAARYGNAELVEVGIVCTSFVVSLTETVCRLSDSPRARSGRHPHQGQRMDCSEYGSPLRRRRDTRGWCRTHFVASMTESFDCQILIDHGADVNHAKDNGWTALHSAAYHADVKVVKVCIARSSLSRCENLPTVRSS